MYLWLWLIFRKKSTFDIKPFDALTKEFKEATIHNLFFHIDAACPPNNSAKEIVIQVPVIKSTVLNK